MTCIALLAALGSGLYLYQEKHTAQLLDRDINRTIKQADTSRDRIGMLRAEWALLNDVERLQTLAGQHLQLQPLAPAQFARLEDLPGRLPAPSAIPVNVAPPEDTPPAPPTPHGPAPIAQLPTAQATPAVLPRQLFIAQAVAPVRLPAPVAVAQASPMVPASPRPAAAMPGPFAAPASASIQLAAVKPAPKPVPPAPRTLAAARPAPEPVFAPMQVSAPRPFYAPLMPAYAPTPVIIHAPTVQTASVMEQRPAPFVGSALGMARSALAAPVPVATAYSQR